MAKGARYYVSDILNLYNDAADARARNNARSTITDTYSSVEGAGTPYLDDNWQYPSSQYPAVSIWWVPSWGGSGYQIGWINDEDNAPPAWVGNASNASTKAKEVWVGNASNVAVRAKEIWVGNSNNVPTKAKV